MPVGTAAQYPQLKDMGLIATIYSKIVNAKYYAQCLLPEITNSMYTGEIKNMGDKVVIAQRPTIVTRDYKKGQNLETQTPESQPIELEVDKAKYYNFVIDDIDADMAHIVLQDEYTDDGNKNMAIDTETDFLSSIIADAAATNQGATAGAKSAAFNLGTAGSPLSVTKSDIIEKLVTAARAVLGETNAVQNGDKGIWMLIPEVLRHAAVNSDLKDASIIGGASALRTGRLGVVDGVTLYSSNLIHQSGTKFYCPFGTKDAVSFAAAMTKSETLRSPNTFGQLYRGLHVYGWKTIKPEALGVAIVTKG